MNQLIRRIRQAHRKQAQSEKGFSQVILLGIIGVLVLAGVGGFLMLQEKKVPSSENEKTVQQEISPPETEVTTPSPKTQTVESNAANPIEPIPPPTQSMQPPKPETRQPIVKSPLPSPSPTPPLSNSPQSGCKGTKTKFDYAPVNMDKTLVMHPLGIMVGDHVSPIDHHFFQNFDNKEFDIEVYSPGPGIMTEIGHMPGAKAGEDYRMVIQHTCTVSSMYIYVSNLPEKIRKQLEGRSEGAYVEIPVLAGEIIGYYKNNLDYNLVDEEVVLGGFAVPGHYVLEPWKIHVPNTYEYFNEPIRSKLIEKSIRTAEPLSGKIDYDVDGKLVGNWFLEGTNYAGPPREKDWTGHLSVVYDAYDPERVVLSVGGYGGEDSKQFGVKGNSPNPKDVGVESGLVKYELVDVEYLTKEGSWWDRISFAKVSKTVASDNIMGVTLAQMIENRKIKFEAFPGKTGAEVSGFTSAARIYER